MSAHLKEFHVIIYCAIMLTSWCSHDSLILTHLELSTDAIDEEFPAVLPGVLETQATHLIPHAVNDVLHLIVREQVWDLTCVQEKQYRDSEKLRVMTAKQIRGSELPFCQVL